jgi:hypothetical protein
VSWRRRVEYFDNETKSKNVYDGVKFRHYCFPGTQNALKKAKIKAQKAKINAQKAKIKVQKAKIKVPKSQI